MECLKAKEGEEAVSMDIYQDERGIRTSAPPNMTRSQVSIAEIAVDAAGDPLVEELRRQVCVQYMMLSVDGTLDPVQTLMGAFMSAFAYGVRIGIEMERVDMQEEA